ncbi:MAG: hypothetical protein MZW92_66455 [Comamonadaceae bacterium]|nr:hypothetical protein [Comamonadaceae bacterium]
MLLNWEALRFRTVYRTLLFLPYAVPGFISILVFQRAVQPELRRDQPDPRRASSASSRPGSPTRSWRR